MKFDEIFGWTKNQSHHTGLDTNGVGSQDLSQFGASGLTARNEAIPYFCFAAAHVGYFAPKTNGNSSSPLKRRGFSNSGISFSRGLYIFRYHVSFREGIRFCCTVKQPEFREMKLVGNPRQKPWTDMCI